VVYKKKFNPSSCCWASTFHSASGIGLVLLFTTGKVELRWWFFLMSAPEIDPLQLLNGEAAVETVKSRERSFLSHIYILKSYIFIKPPVSS
jgi:succinate dehydrogenase/fumarate reductase cytochrome b subunit